MPTSGAMQNNFSPSSSTNDVTTTARSNHNHHSNSNSISNSISNSNYNSHNDNSPVPRPKWTLNAGLKSCSTSPQVALNLPSALDHISEFLKQVVTRKCRIVFFLDYDGTLSPIVDDPDTATMPSPVRRALSEVSSKFTTAIVTGRSKKKVMEMVNLDHLIYAASHGFDIHSPDERISHRVACEFIPVMKQVAHDLRILSDEFAGTHVEDNFLSVTLHFRHVESRCQLELLLSRVNKIATRYGVRRHDGKMVHELRPPHDWHKGKAVDYLLSTLELNGPDVLPIYIGDDISDESAFEAIRDRGISVIVAEESLARTTCADLRLKDPFEVGKFLMHFAAHQGLVA